LIGAYKENQDAINATYSKTSGTFQGKLENTSIVYPSIQLGTAEFLWQGPKGEPIIVMVTIQLVFG